ncbi:glycoside hydrolase [Mollisia scopiformis]|uniref:glucan 1,3-beta-glucosidase n=1 Tax=Mollisia scopiformis TaxID=149040 RepID=A0A194XSJ3_MOLSC|nr:glycoside hydrolase [Mollisia scopiformis]KUJ23009.1 glycoside hydrolase [Mollisia scopiformis]
MPRDSERRGSERPRAGERSHHHERKRRTRKPRHQTSSSQSGSQLLSADALAHLDRLNHHRPVQTEEITPKKTRRKRPREFEDERVVVVEKSRREHKRKSRRAVSGVLLEEGDGRTLRGMRGGDRRDKYDRYDRYEKDESYEEEPPKSKRKWLIIGGIVVLLIVIIVVAVVVSQKKNSKSSSSSASSESGTPSNSNLDGISESSIPAAAKGTYLDPFSWYDTTDFNVTYTNVTVGGLPIMGLNSTWDDSVSANSNVPPISTAWGSYADRPARGVNLGGWLSLEPFITPSLFNYASDLGIIDEWTLTTHLGASAAKSTLEKHYATFVGEQTFKDIADAGLDHVRIPFSYWAVTTYDSDPYVFRVSWRYLLRGIEWARKYGLRINLDLHGLPGSQNGWNHSGRQGTIGWLNGTDGSLNANRSLEIHDQLSQFFAQDRYKNILAFYGLANEPKMTALVVSDVLSWTTSAYEIIHGNGIDAYVVFGDGFLGLSNWQGKLTGYSNLVLDAHQYVIFNVNQIDFNHTEKISYACTDWTSQSEASMSTTTGFGPTIFAEWSQADTDCAVNLNNVGVGNRWTGTYDFGDTADQVLSPDCPTKNSQCECTDANADASSYSSTYKQFLLMFAEAQMTSFETGWGWWYWTWVTEDATQWSYQLGLAAGILPAKAYARDFNCSSTIPSFSGLPEYY